MKIKISKILTTNFPENMHNMQTYVDKTMAKIAKNEKNYRNYKSAVGNF